MTDGVTLLRYALVPAPDPLQAGAAGQLTLAVSNMGKEPVDLTGVAVTLPLGANADDLAVSSDGIGTAVVPNGGWQVAHTDGSATFTFTPPGGKVRVAGAGYALELTSIPVNDQVGPVRAIIVVETASTASQPSQARTWTSQQLAKLPKGFSLSDLTADPVEVDAGGSTSLMWTATSGSYTMQRDDQPSKQPWSVGLTGPETEYDLAAPPRVTFSLVGMVDTMRVLRQATVGVRAKAPTIGCFSGSVSYDPAGVCALTFHWQTNATSCVIPQAGAEQLAADSPPQGYSVPLTSPRIGSFELDAYNDAGQSSKSLLVQWMEESRAGLGSSSALSPDGKRLYVIGGTTLGVFQLAPDRLAAPTRTSTWEAPEGDQLLAVAVVSSGGQDLIWVVSFRYRRDDDSYRVFYPLLVSPSGTPQPAADPTLEDFGAYPTYGDLDLAVVPDGTVILTDSAGPLAIFYVPGERRQLYGAFTIPLGSMGDSSGGVSVAPDGTFYIAGSSWVASYVFDERGALNLIRQQQLGGDLHGVAAASEALFVVQGAQTLVLDRQTLAPVRPPIAAGGRSLDAQPDGMRLYASAGSQLAPVSVLAPGALAPAPSPAASSGPGGIGDWLRLNEEEDGLDHSRA
jgi:hypothetical protein